MMDTTAIAQHKQRPQLVVENHETKLIELPAKRIARAVAAIFGRRIPNLAIEHLIGKQGRVLASTALIETR
jgi:hypothetical protein